MTQSEHHCMGHSRAAQVADHAGVAASHAPLSWRRSLFRAFVAYAIALQAILTVWGGAFAPANAADDVFSVICRSVSAAQGQDQTDPVKRSSDHGLACHCTAACAAGGGCCGSGAAGLAIVLPLPQGRKVAQIQPDATFGAMGDVLAMLHRARAPPIET